MKAPNGQKSNLNEQQWVDVRTKRFKDWFGDWENDPKNASKVVDDCIKYSLFALVFFRISSLIKSRFSRLKLVRFILLYVTFCNSAGVSVLNETIPLINPAPFSV